MSLVLVTRRPPGMQLKMFNDVIGRSLPFINKLLVKRCLSNIRLWEKSLISFSQTLDVLPVHNFHIMNDYLSSHI